LHLNEYNIYLKEFQSHYVENLSILFNCTIYFMKNYKLNYRQA